MSLHHGLRSAAGASVADPYFANTSLLLLGNGSNGGQNNSFVDGSSNAFSITRYGNTTQGTFSPFGYNWSNYFDGSGDYLTVADSATLELGSQDFSIELFYYPTSITGNKSLLAKRANPSTDYGFVLFASGTSLQVYISSGNTSYDIVNGTTIGTLSTNQWFHVSVYRIGNAWYASFNGTITTLNASNSSSVWNNSAAWGIGAESNGAGTITGYISNLRILIGSSAYTSTSAPIPTAPLTAITNTSLLTCQSNRFIDNSSNAFAITPYGDAKVTNFAPFATGSEYSTGTNGGSGYFDGSGDYLTVADSTAFDLTGDFTLELFFYPTAWDNSWSIGLGSENSGQNGFTFYANGTSNMGVYGNGAHIIQVTCDAKLYEWNHLALVRSGSTLTLYLNGVSKSTATNSTSFTGITANGFSLGAVYTSTLRVDNPKGYCSSLRLAKSAVYTAAFTPPTSPLTSITNTSLLLNFVNGSIIDSTGKNDLETVGDAQISTATKKFGTGSLKFDGMGDYLTIPKSSLLDFGTGDFTIEAWIYPTTASGVIIDTRTQDTLDAYIFNLSGTGKLDFIYSSSRVTSSASISTSVWTHVAVVRNSGTIKLYINGTEDGSASYSSAVNAQSFASIGGGRSSASTSVNGYYFNGYIDDLRISKVARYTAAFTPPTRQFPAR